MRTTAEYELFPDAPSERALARARWLAREGRVTEAADAYRDVLASHPLLKPCWAEYFELLRRGGRAADALRVAEGAAAQFGRSEEHTSELQSPCNLVCRLLLEKKKKKQFNMITTEVWGTLSERNKVS